MRTPYVLLCLSLLLLSISSAFGFNEGRIRADLSRLESDVESIEKNSKNNGNNGGNEGFSDSNAELAVNSDIQDNIKNNNAELAVNSDIQDNIKNNNDPLCAAINGKCVDSKDSSNCGTGGKFVSGKCKQAHHGWFDRCCVMPESPPSDGSEENPNEEKEEEEEEDSNSKNDPLCAGIDGNCLDSRDKTKCLGGNYVSGKCKQSHHGWFTRCCVMPPPDTRSADEKLADENWDFLLSRESLSNMWDIDVPYTFGLPFARKIVTSAQKNEFGAKYVLPAKARNVWADILLKRVREYQAENGITVDGKINGDLIARLKAKGPGGTPGMKTAEWADYWDTRNTEDAANLAKIRDAEGAPSGRDLVTAIKFYHVGRFSAKPMNIASRKPTKYGWQFIRNFYEQVFTGPNKNDCRSKGASPGCNNKIVTMGMNSLYEKWFPVPNRFFWKACTPKPAYVKNRKASCSTGTNPSSLKHVTCPADKTCVNQGAWSYCGIAVTASVKMATGDENIRWGIGPVGGTPAGYPGCSSSKQKSAVASMKITDLGVEGPLPGDHMQLSVANSHQDMMWCGTDQLIYTIDSNGYGQETATNAKERNRKKGNFYSFYRTVPVEESDAQRFSNMDCAKEWSMIVERSQKIAQLLDKLAGRKSPWKY